LQAKFQFHDGAIGSSNPHIAIIDIGKFQFHDGAIGSVSGLTFKYLL